MTFHLIYSPMKTPAQQHPSPVRPSSITNKSSAPSSPVVGLLRGGGAVAGFARIPMSVDGDDEDFTYQSQADTVLDADTYDDLGSVSSMVTDQWADQNPGDSVVSVRKQLVT
jgi:hypothetical protein